MWFFTQWRTNPCWFLSFTRMFLNTGFPVEPGNLENREIIILSLQVQKYTRICPQKCKNLYKRNLAENMDKTWNVKKYNPWFYIMTMLPGFLLLQFKNVFGICLLVPKLSALKPGEWLFGPGQILEITWNFMSKTTGTHVNRITRLCHIM